MNRETTNHHLSAALKGVDATWTKSNDGLATATEHELHVGLDAMSPSKQTAPGTSRSIRDQVAAPSSRAGTWPQTPTRARAPWERGRCSADPPLRRFPPARARRGPRENVTGAGQGGVSQATSQVHASSQPGRPGLQRPGAESDETTSAVWRPPAVRRQRPRPRASGRGPRQKAGVR